MKVVDLEGVEWRVRRRWLPRYQGRGLRERLRQRRARSAGRRDGDGGRWFDVLDIPLLDSFDDTLGAVVVVVLAIVLLFVLVIFAIPLLLALVDFVVVVAVAVLGVAGRVVFRRPWTVEAMSATGACHEVRVVGWRRAGETVRSVAGDIGHGHRVAAAPG